MDIDEARPADSVRMSPPECGALSGCEHAVSAELSDDAVDASKLHKFACEHR